jgi:hypothetical protein
MTQCRMYHNKESTQGGTLDSSTHVWQAIYSSAGLQSPNRTVTLEVTTTVRART